ncbi:MAG TPA: hypothetical protein VGK53_00060 [Propionicimonas sp.]
MRSWTRAGVPAPSWLGRRRAILVLVALVISIGFGLSVAPEGAIAPTGAATGYGDADLYRELAARVRAGEPYYPAAVSLQQLHGYPTTPFVVVRPPTLTLLRVALGDGLSTALLVALGAAGILALGRQVGRAGASRVEWFGAVLLLGVNAALYAVAPIGWFSEAWAGALIMLAIGLRGEKHWWPAVIVGLAAACFRELALPFLLVMAAVSWHQRRRREAAGWLAAVGVFCVLLALHAVAVQAAQPLDPVTSPGWVRFGGWSFVLNAVATSSVLWILPWVTVAFIVPLALFGWLFAGRPGQVVLSTCGLFIAGFLVIGRTNNTYWGLLFAAVLVAGLAFAPRGLVTTIRVALGRPPHPHGDAR